MPPGSLAGAVPGVNGAAETVDVLGTMLASADRASEDGLARRAPFATRLKGPLPGQSIGTTVLPSSVTYVRSVYQGIGAVAGDPGSSNLTLPTYAAGDRIFFLMMMQQARTFFLPSATQFYLYSASASQWLGGWYQDMTATDVAVGKTTLPVNWNSGSSNGDQGMLSLVVGGTRFKQPVPFGVTTYDPGNSTGSSPTFPNQPAYMAQVPPGSLYFLTYVSVNSSGAGGTVTNGFTVLRADARRVAAYKAVTTDTDVSMNISVVGSNGDWVGFALPPAA